MGKGSGLGKFVAGVGIGVGLGMLFAPKKGSELRQDLKTKIQQLIKAAQEIDYKDVKDRIISKANEIQEDLKDLNKEKAIKLAKTKAKQIEKKANELVDMAVETARPAVEKLANEVRTKTVQALKKVTKKLEDAK